MPPITIYLILILSILIPPHPTTADQSFISVLITQNGLNFVKNLLITKAISALTPTPLPQIEQVVKIPVIGEVHIVLSDITIYRFEVGSSDVRPGIDGVSIFGPDVSCGLSLNWHYSYGTWVLPISISDSGSADIEVNGMEMGLTLGLKNEEGSIELSVTDYICNILDFSIDLDGGASWLYQGIVDVFADQIASLVEKSIVKTLKTSVSKLEYFLKNLPKLIPVYNYASLNVTFVNNPFMSDNSLGFEINGLFIDSKTNTLLYQNQLQPPISCSNPSNMVGIALDEAVFRSAFAAYYNAMFMHWIVDKIPDQSLLNTFGWRFIIPQLYRRYPNDDMNLNISLSDPPVVQIYPQKIGATIYADFIIDVLHDFDTIPVACISLAMNGMGSVAINGNNLVSHLKVDDFTMSLKWSRIGTLHMFLIKPVMWTLVESVVLPYVNARLGLGFPLPIIRGFMLENAEIISSDSILTVCSEVSYKESFNNSPTQVYAL